MFFLSSMYRKWPVPQVVPACPLVCWGQSHSCPPPCFACRKSQGQPLATSPGRAESHRVRADSVALDRTAGRVCQSWLHVFLGRYCMVLGKSLAQMLGVQAVDICVLAFPARGSGLWWWEQPPCQRPQGTAARVLRWRANPWFCSREGSFRLG